MLDAYVAGLVDADGSIIISKVNDHWPTHRSPAYRVSVQVTNTHRPVLEELTAKYGGSVSNKPLTKGSFFSRQRHYNWSVSGQRAIDMLECLRPYLRIKAQQAWLALEFWSQRIKSPGPHPLAPEELAMRDGFYWAMKSLKGTV